MIVDYKPIKERLSKLFDSKVEINILKFGYDYLNDFLFEKMKYNEMIEIKIIDRNISIIQNILDEEYEVDFFGNTYFQEKVSIKGDVSKEKEELEKILDDIFYMETDAHIERLEFIIKHKKKNEEIVLEKKENVDMNDKLIKILNDTNVFFQYQLFEKVGEKALSYLRQRGITNEDIKKYKIGYAIEKGLFWFLKSRGHDTSDMINASILNDSYQPFFNNRIMFAITDENDDVIGFSGRVLDDQEPKYINSKTSRIFSKSNTLYNYKKNKGNIYLNEGFMDVIAMNKSGIKNSLAIMGTSLTESHLSKLNGNKIYLMLDLDEAGIKATINSIELLIENNIECYVVLNNLGNDPDEIYNKYGGEKLKEVSNKTIKGIEFIYWNFFTEYKDKGLNGIKSFIERFSFYLNSCVDLERTLYIDKISKSFDLSFYSVENEFSKFM